MKFSRMLPVIAGLCLPVPVAASDEPSLIVTATRSEQERVLIPAGLAVISREELVSSGATSVAEALRGRAGIQLTDSFGDGSNTTVDMRGFGESAGSNVLIMVDGQRLNNADIDAPDISSVSLKDVERIEIIQGSAGSLYGDQAVGGVINIITRSPEKFNAAVRVSAGSFGREYLAASVSDKAGRNFSYRLSAETLATDNFREHNRLEYDNLHARLNYGYDSGSAFLEIQDTDKYSEQPGALLENEVKQNPEQSLPDFADDFSRARNQAARLGMRQTVSDHWAFAGEVAGRDSDSPFILNFRGCSTSLFFPCNVVPDEETRAQRSFTPRLLGAYPVDYGDILLTVGADVIESDYDIESAFTTRSNDQRIESLYVQAVIPVSDAFSYTVSGRRAEVSNELVDQTVYPGGQVMDDDVSVSGLGINFTPGQQWRLFARLDENFRFAKVDEQSFTIAGTIGLRTQEGESKEAGMEWRSASGNSFKVVAYRLDLENEIAFDPTANGPFGPFGGANVNLDSTRREGFTLEGSYYVNADLRLYLTSAHIDAVFESGVFAGKEISGVAERVQSLALDYRFSDHCLAYLEVQDFGEQYLAGDNANALARKPGYRVVNANFAYNPEPWRFSARINNLGDREYTESANAFGALLPSPPRNFWISVEYSFE